MYAPRNRAPRTPERNCSPALAAAIGIALACSLTLAAGATYAWLSTTFVNSGNSITMTAGPASQAEPAATPQAEPEPAPQSEPEPAPQSEPEPAPQAVSESDQQAPADAPEHAGSPDLSA